MRISRVGRCSKGFTLIELIVAIFIISLVLSLSLPSLTSIGESRIGSDAKRIASILRYLNDSAIATKESLSLKVGLREKVVFYTGPDGEKSERFESISGIDLQSKGKLTEGEATVFFGPSGSSESFQIYLHSDKQDLSVVLNALSGRVKIFRDEKP